MARGPSAANWVTLLLLAAAATAGYGTWKFFPVYWTAWQVDHVLAEGASRAYEVSRQRDAVEKARAKEKLIAALRSEVVALGVTDPDMTVGLNFGTDRVDLSCDYRAIVIHPVGGRYTVLLLRRKASGSLRPSGF